jgi:hypothetical protein
VFQHEELYRAEVVSALPLRVAFIGLWTQCDRRGCFEWKPSRLKLHVLPFDNVDFSAVLSALESGGFVRSYVVDGKRFGQVPTLPLHQTFHVNEKPNLLIPEPPPLTCTVPAPPQYGASTTVVISGTGTVTGTVAAVIAPTATDVAEGAIELTRTANAAIAARFGEQADPLIASSGKSHVLAQAVLDAGIPFDFAMRSVARQVTTLDKPVRTMAYFRLGILDDWAKHNAKQEAKNARPVTPLDRNGEVEQTRPRRGGSPPVPDDGTICATCGTKETHIVNRRIVPKHLDGCALGAAIAQVAK